MCKCVLNTLRRSALPTKDNWYNQEAVSLTVNKQATEQSNTNLAKHLNHTALSQSANLIMAEDTRQDKRASFSAITEHNPNGMARTSAVASSKSGASKKLVIKNFKGIVTDRFPPFRYLQHHKSHRFVLIRKLSVSGLCTCFDCKSEV